MSITSGDYLYTDVFVKRQGHWQAVNSQDTLLADNDGDPHLFDADHATNSVRVTPATEGVPRLNAVGPRVDVTPVSISPVTTAFKVNRSECYLGSSVEC